MCLDRRERFKIVKNAIDEFDPYLLLIDESDPEDEYDFESADIEGEIGDKSTVDEIAEIISKVFSKAFDRDFDIEECRKPAEKIYMGIRNTRL